MQTKTSKETNQQLNLRPDLLDNLHDLQTHTISDTHEIKADNHQQHLTNQQTISKTTLKNQPLFDFPHPSNSPDNSKSQIYQKNPKQDQTQQYFPKHQLHNYKSKGQLNLINKNDLQLYDNKIKYLQDHLDSLKNKSPTKLDHFNTIQSLKQHNIPPKHPPKYNKFTTNIQHHFKQSIQKQKQQMQIIQIHTMKLVQKQKKQRQLIKIYQQINSQNTNKINRLQLLTIQLSNKFNKSQQIIQQMKYKIGKITTDYNTILQKQKLSNQQTFQLTSQNTQLTKSLKQMHSQITDLKQKVLQIQIANKQKQSIIQYKSQQLSHLQKQLFNLSKLTKSLSIQLNQLKQHNNQLSKQQLIKQIPSTSIQVNQQQFNDMKNMSQLIQSHDSNNKSQYQQLKKPINLNEEFNPTPIFSVFDPRKQQYQNQNKKPQTDVNIRQIISKTELQNEKNQHKIEQIPNNKQQQPQQKKQQIIDQNKPQQKKVLKRTTVFMDDEEQAFSFDDQTQANIDDSKTHRTSVRSVQDQLKAEQLIQKTMRDLKNRAKIRK